VPALCEAPAVRPLWPSVEPLLQLGAGCNRHFDRATQGTRCGRNFHYNLEPATLHFGPLTTARVRALSGVKLQPNFALNHLPELLTLNFQRRYQNEGLGRLRVVS
jgi:hypothetical protein